jgi:Na+/glutamate symporter
MKEASGELNGTVFVILAVGVLMAFFYFVLWPVIHQNFKSNSQCSRAICGTTADASGYVTCHEKGKTETFKCVYKG